MGTLYDAGGGVLLDRVIISNADGTLPAGGVNATVNMATALSSAIDSVSTEGGKATYSASGTAALTNADAMTILFAVRGSATKTVRVRRLRWLIRGSGTLRQYIWQVVKYSAFPTGGTLGGLTAVPHDSADSAASGASGVWTAHPTAGASVGNILISTAAVLDADAVFADATQFNTIALCDVAFGAVDDKAIVLRGVAETLGVTVSLTSATGDIAAVSATWTEE
jgi:hypothetical protein